MTSAPQVATVLQSILHMEGLRILHDPSRFRNLLTERAPQQPTREREILLRALESPVFERTWQAKARGASISLVGLAQWLADEHGYVEDLCRWGEETWALALGIPPASTPSATQPPPSTAVRCLGSDAPLELHPTVDLTVAREDGVPSPERLIARLQDKNLSHQERFEIGQALAEIGDTRPGVGLRADGLPDIVWIQIPGGPVIVKESDKLRKNMERGVLSRVFGPKPKLEHTFNVLPFRLAQYPVTNAQFLSFLTVPDGYYNDVWWNGIELQRDPNPVKQSSFFGAVNAPRVVVSWFDAVAFCRWLSAKTRTRIRLPTEWEWQQAATGGNQDCTYPWGSDWDDSRCNGDTSGLKQTIAVGMYPAGATRQGLYDMVGNVWEWCLNRYQDPERPDAVNITDEPAWRVVRGGSYHNLTGSVPMRGGERSPFHDPNIGFRLLQEL